MENQKPNRLELIKRYFEGRRGYKHSLPSHLQAPVLVEDVIELGRDLANVRPKESNEAQ